jgi:dolichol-phosphate mannosyltransferase
MISIIVPTLNEPYVMELIKTIDRINLPPYEIHIRTDKGLANAVLAGVKISKGEVITIMDGDGSHNPKYIQPMIDQLDKADIIIGSRYVEGGNSNDYFIRHIISRLYCKIARSLLNLNISDTMSGFVVAKKEVFDNLDLRPLGYKFALEMVLKGKNRYKVLEYPVTFDKRKMGRSKTGALQGLKTLQFIIKLWLWKIQNGE